MPTAVIRRSVIETHYTKENYSSNFLLLTLSYSMKPSTEGGGGLAGSEGNGWCSRCSSMKKLFDGVSRANSLGNGLPQRAQDRNGVLRQTLNEESQSISRNLCDFTTTITITMPNTVEEKEKLMDIEGYKPKDLRLCPPLWVSVGLPLQIALRQCRLLCL